jgi:hypothetical protein
MLSIAGWQPPTRFRAYRMTSSAGCATIPCITMILRVVIMLAATLLHAAQGANGLTADTMPGEEHRVCAYGCCTADLSTCACVAENDAPGKEPTPAAPAPTRESAPQVAGLAMAAAHFFSPATMAGDSTHGWEQRYARSHGPHVPLTVLHCSFLH